MKNLSVLIICAFLFNACTIRPVYEKEKSIKNAQYRLYYIKEAAEGNSHFKNTYYTHKDKNIIAFKESQSTTCVRGYFYRENNINNNMDGETEKDFEKLLEDNFLILRKQYYRTGVSNMSSAWVTSYIIGDGSVRIDRYIRGKDFWYLTSRCRSGAHKAFSYERISLHSLNEMKPENALNRDISKVNEKAFIEMSKKIDHAMDQAEIEYQEQKEINSNNRRKRNAYIAKQNEERRKSNAAHFIALQKKINNNMKFYTQNNMQYVKQQNQINSIKKKNHFQSNTYTAPNINKVVRQKKINTIHQAYFQDAILRAKISQKTKPINYYTKKSTKPWPTGLFHDCNEEYTSLSTLENKYRAECKFRFGTSEAIVKQCANQGSAKAKDEFLKKYKSWFGRECPGVKAGVSSGKHDYEK